MVLLARLREAADRLHLPATVLTFNPHPRQYFALKTGTMAHAPATITPLREKIQALSRCHIDQVMIARFNNTTAGLSSEEFIEKILVKALNVKWLIIGENFRFGKGRTGTIDELKKAGERYGFHVEVLPAVKDENGRISSSCIRKALEESDFETVATLLGKPYAISGHVVHGDKNGSESRISDCQCTHPALQSHFVGCIHYTCSRFVRKPSSFGIDDRGEHRPSKATGM